MNRSHDYHDYHENRACTVVGEPLQIGSGRKVLACEEDNSMCCLELNSPDTATNLPRVLRDLPVKGQIAPEINSGGRALRREAQSNVLLVP